MRTFCERLLVKCRDGRCGGEHADSGVGRHRRRRAARCRARWPDSATGARPPPHQRRPGRVRRRGVGTRRSDDCARFEHPRSNIASRHSSTRGATRRWSARCRRRSSTSRGERHAGFSSRRPSDRSGRQAEALRSISRFRTELGEELGLDPSPELDRLEHRILDHDPTLLAASHRRQALHGYELDEMNGEGAFSLVSARHATIPRSQGGDQTDPRPTRQPARLHAAGSTPKPRQWPPSFTGWHLPAQDEKRKR